MADPRLRAEVRLVKDAYNYLFHSSHSLSKIKDTALNGRLFNASQNAGVAVGVAGRSLAWKLFLVHGEPLQTSANELVVLPLDEIRALREEFRKLLLERMRAPDGSYEESFVVPGSNASPPRPEKNGVNLETNNPLSLHDENPWKVWFASVELRKTILQDVERTFPDIDYFRDAEVQAELTNILFLYSDMHPDIGYRQGMHELLAPLYHAVDFDSIAEETRAIEDPAMKEFCARLWVAADAWMLFTAVMNGAGKWYEWQERKDAQDTSPLAAHVQLNVSAADARVKAYVAPIVDACNRIQNVLLKSTDPELWKAMQTAGIEPQIYGIRWLRLLFTREFSMLDAMVLWDGLFACDPTFDLALWICVAMLLRIRNQLLSSDYSGQLTYLLRYPSPSTTSEPTIHHATLLLRQALILQSSPTPTTGVTIIHENRNLLDIPVDVPAPSPPPVQRSRRHGGRGPSIGNEVSLAKEASGSKSAHDRQQSSPMGLPEMFARGLLERGESLGINKTVMNAMSEFKRNLPDLSATLGRLPLTPSTPLPAYPLADERPPNERPPWEPRTRFEMERDITKLKIVQQRLGDSVSWIVDTLLLDENDAPDDAAKQGVKRRKREALESLSYVRDVLKNGSTELDEDRLVGEEELERRRSKALEEQRKMASQPRVPSPPPPVASAPLPAEARPQGAGTRRLPDYFSGQSAKSPTATEPPRHSAHLPPPLSAVPSPTLPPPVSSSPFMTPRSSAVSPGTMPLAPWRHTPSSFSREDSPIAALPRLPPKMSTALRPSSSLPSSLRSPPPETIAGAREQNVRRVQHDPLGALP